MCNSRRPDFPVLRGLRNTPFVQRRLPVIPRKRVLIIDDDAKSCELLAAILGQTYVVTVARNGKAGVASALSDPPDLILCDILMAWVDGAPVVEQIQNNGATAHIPVVLMTANHELIGLPETKGAMRFLQKPFETAQVHTLIADAISRAS